MIDNKVETWWRMKVSCEGILKGNKNKRINKRKREWEK